MTHCLLTADETSELPSVWCVCKIKMKREVCPLKFSSLISQGRTRWSGSWTYMKTKDLREFEVLPTLWSIMPVADSLQDAAGESVWYSSSQQQTDRLCSSFHIIGIYEREKCARCLQPLVPDFCWSSGAKRRKYISSFLGMLTIKRMMYYPGAPGLRCEYSYCHFGRNSRSREEACSIYWTSWGHRWRIYSMSCILSGDQNIHRLFKLMCWESRIEKRSQITEGVPASLYRSPFYLSCRVK